MNKKPFPSVIPHASLFRRFTMSRLVVSVLQTMYLCVMCVIPMSTRCPGKDGGDVEWWVVFQENSRPFFHFYADSHNTQNVTFYKPESSDSVLSRVIDLMTTDTLSQHVVYSNDLVNVKNIAETFTFPTYGKWMQGILATDSSVSSGVWILHNNFLFPSIKDGMIEGSSSARWTSTTVGDVNEDLFYICLSINTHEDFVEVIKNVLAGNPFIFYKRLDDIDLDKYFTEIREYKSSFSSYASANMFMECMYATSNTTSRHCLYKYAANSKGNIRVFTRPRGMVRGDRQFCYNQHAPSRFDFVGLTTSENSNALSSHNIFVLSQDTTSQLYGVTCFGQDIAASADTVAVMICAELPGLWMTLVHSSQMVNSQCQNPHQTTSSPEQTEISPPKSKDSSIGTKSFSVGSEIPTVHIRNKRDIRSSAKTQTKSKRDKRDISSTAQPVHTRSKRDVSSAGEAISSDGSVSSNQKTKLPNFKSSLEAQTKFLRVDSKEDAKTDTITSKFRESLEAKQPIQKPPPSKEEPETLIKIDTTKEIQEKVLQNEQQVIAIFCSRSCSHCRKAELVIMQLMQEFLEEEVDFLYVDIAAADVPLELQVDWTPYVRYKPPGISSLSDWVDYKGTKYQYRPLHNFIDENIVRPAQRSRGPASAAS